jgi:hypothetical protein
MAASAESLGCQGFKAHFLPSAAVGLEAALRAAPNGVHAEHLGAAALA